MKTFIIRVLSRYDHRQLNINLPKKRYKILALQDKNLYNLKKGLLYHCHLQSQQCMKQVMCILKVCSFGISFPILLNPEFQCLCLHQFPAGIYLIKVNNRNTRAKVYNMFKVGNKATKMTPMASFWWL